VTRDRPAATAPQDSQVEIRIVSGGVPTVPQEAAIAIAVRRVITQRDDARATPPPLWGAVGRIEARDGLSIRSRAGLPRTLTWSPAVEAPE
jgi:hypothetical protein